MRNGIRWSGALVVLWLACGPRNAEAAPALLEVADAQRFAQLFAQYDGHPDAASLQRGYLDPASPGLRAYGADGIGDAAQLARALAADPGKYRRAIEECLPQGAAQEAAVAAIFKRYQQLFPGTRPPPVYLLFGSGNALGLATAQRSVAISLEQLCAQDDWRASLRGLVAHETAHTLQPALEEDSPLRRDLLAWALREGAASYLAGQVTGQRSDGGDNTWAVAREQALLREFLRDRQTLREHWQGSEPDAQAIAAGTRWMWNSGREDGGPRDLAYWTGLRIWNAYARRHPQRALRAMIELPDADDVLRDSGYAEALGVKSADAAGTAPLR